MKRLFALATIFVSLTANINAHPHHAYYDEPVYYTPPARVYYSPTPFYPPTYNCRPQRVQAYGYSGYAQPYYGPEIRFGVGGGWSRFNFVIR